jgi:hypothetical protein
MNDIELKRKRIETVVKILALLVVGFFVAPFVFISIKGLAGLAIAFILSLTVLNFIPWFAAKLANWKLKALKAEASTNPIETLQNDYMARMNALASFRDSIRDFSAQVGIFKEKLVGFKEKYPKDANKFDEQVNQMKTLLQLRKQKYEEAKGNLESYELEIQKADAIWQMSLAAAEMNKAAGVDTDEFYAKIQVETALDSVQKSLNSAFADLEVSLLDEKGKKPALPASTTENTIAIDTKGSRKPLTLDLDPV